MYHSMYFFLKDYVLGKENTIEEQCQLFTMETNMNIKNTFLSAKQSPFRLWKSHLPFKNVFLRSRIYPFSTCHPGQQRP